MNAFDLWRQQMDVVTKTGFWNDTLNQILNNSVTSNVFNLSPYIGGSFYNFDGIFFGYDGEKEHDDMVFVGDYSLPLPG